jgi:hypothetical protein
MFETHKYKMHSFLLLKQVVNKLTIRLQRVKNPTYIQEYRIFTKRSVRYSNKSYQVFPLIQQVLWKGSEAGMEVLHLKPTTCLGAPATSQHIPDSSHAPVNITAIYQT